VGNFRLLDLFCGAGGASMGYYRAGFEIVGIDIKPQPHYPFEFHQSDALTYPLEGFDAYHASPPCQAWCKYGNVHKDLAEKYPNVIDCLRMRLQATKKPYVIENVPNAPLANYIVRLCGSSFYLPIRRHRHFESSIPLLTPPCNHSWQKPQYPSSTDRKPMSRCTMEIGSWDIPLAQQREGMGIDWMTVEELSEAIPPAYTEYIGRYLMKVLEL
jgi:DNA (cytosine-5)-methyltransferase 1